MTNRNRQARPVQWYSTIMPLTSLASAGQITVSLLSVATVPLARIRGSTITRIVMKLRAHSTNLATLHEVHWGIVLMNADAVAAGGFPDADDASDRADWMVRGWLSARAASLSDQSQDDVTELDLRAQRILRSEEEDLRLIMDADASGSIVQLSAFVRVLLKYP